MEKRKPVDETVYNKVYDELMEHYKDGAIKDLPTTLSRIDYASMSGWFLKFNNVFLMLENGITTIVISKTRTEFVKNDNLHCLTGPARMDYQDKTKEYWIDGGSYSSQEFYEHPLVINNPLNIQEKMRLILGEDENQT